MSKQQWLIILGVWVLLLPFMGFPESWDKIIGVLSGLVIVAVAYRLKPAAPRTLSPSAPFVEHKSEPAASSDSINGPISPSAS